MIPRYRQVKAHVLEAIERGELGPRDRVPSENQLVERLGVSRMTAHRALRELTAEGIVERVAGVGTFVTDLRARSHVLEVRNIADEIRSRGHVHAAQVLELATEPAPPALAEALEVAPRTTLAHSLIVHHESGSPIQVEDRYVVADAVPGYLEADFERETPNAVLSRALPLQRAEHAVRAEAADPAVSRWLALDPGEPCLVIERKTWSGGRPVSLAFLYHPGTRYELTGALGSRRP